MPTKIAISINSSPKPMLSVYGCGQEELVFIEVQLADTIFSTKV
jgi:hypothetical protein